MHSLFKKLITVVISCFLRKGRHRGYVGGRFLEFGVKRNLLFFLCFLYYLHLLSWKHGLLKTNKDVKQKRKLNAKQNHFSATRPTFYGWKSEAKREGPPLPTKLPAPLLAPSVPAKLPLTPESFTLPWLKH